MIIRNQAKSLQRARAAAAALGEGVRRRFSFRIFCTRRLICRMASTTASSGMLAAPRNSGVTRPAKVTIRSRRCCADIMIPALAAFRARSALATLPARSALPLHHRVRVGSACRVGLALSAAVPAGEAQRTHLRRVFCNERRSPSRSSIEHSKHACEMCSGQPGHLIKSMTWGEPCAMQKLCMNV